MKSISDFKNSFAQTFSTKNTTAKGCYADATPLFNTPEYNVKVVNEMVNKFSSSITDYKASIHGLNEIKFVKDFCQHVTNLKETLQTSDDNELKTLVTTKLTEAIIACASAPQLNTFGLPNYTQVLPIAMLAELQQQNIDDGETIDYNTILDGCKNNKTIKELCNTLRELNPKKINGYDYSLKLTGKMSKVIDSIADPKPYRPGNARRDTNYNSSRNTRNDYGYNRYNNNDDYNSPPTQQVIKSVVFNKWTNLSSDEKKALLIEQLTIFAKEDPSATPENIQELESTINKIEIAPSKATTDLSNPTESSRKKARKEITTYLHPDKLFKVTSGDDKDIHGKALTKEVHDTMFADRFFADMFAKTE